MLNAGISTLSVVAFFIAICLASQYENQENPKETSPLLRSDTYNTVFPFLLGTIAAGGVALTYTRVQNSREIVVAKNKSAKALLKQRIERLQEIYVMVLNFFQDIRLNIRRLSLVLIHDPQDKEWKIRRSLWEDITIALNKSQLVGEQIVKTLEFEEDALQSLRKGDNNDSIEDIKKHEKLLDDLRSQVGGMEGVLRNALRILEWKSITIGTKNDNDYVIVPPDFVEFSKTSSDGNVSYLKIIQYFSKFSKNIRSRIAELEVEYESYGDF